MMIMEDQNGKMEDIMWDNFIMIKCMGMVNYTILKNIMLVSFRSSFWPRFLTKVMKEKDNHCPIKKM